MRSQDGRSSLYERFQPHRGRGRTVSLQKAKIRCGRKGRDLETRPSLPPEPPADAARSFYFAARGAAVFLETNFSLALRPLGLAQAQKSQRAGVSKICTSPGPSLALRPLTPPPPPGPPERPPLQSK